MQVPPSFLTAFPAPSNEDGLVKGVSSECDYVVQNGCKAIACIVSSSDCTKTTLSSQAIGAALGKVVSNDLGRYSMVTRAMACLALTFMSDDVAAWSRCALLTLCECQEPDRRKQGHLWLVYRCALRHLSASR